MNHSETSRMLAVAAAFDRRTIGEVDVSAWAAVLGHVAYADAVEAVRRHYATETTWIMPAHVLQHAGRIRRERLDAAPELGEPDADPDDTVAYLAAIREGRFRRSTERKRRHIDYRSVFRPLPAAEQPAEQPREGDTPS